MTTIVPTQNIISSVVTQNNPLSSVSGSAYVPNVAANTVATDTAVTSNVSDKHIGASSLYNASLELAGLTSQLQVTQVGTQQVSNILQNLQSIAQQISSGSGDTTSLESEFETLYSQLQQIVASTSFGGTNLLDGSTSYDTNPFGTSSDQSASFTPNLSTQSLFGNNPPSVTTPQNAENAIGTIGTAINKTNDVGQTLEDINNQVNFVTANVDTAQANNYASSSTLTEAELSGAGFTNFADELSNKPESSATAQTGKLSSNTLKLLNG